VITKWRFEKKKKKMRAVRFETGKLRKRTFATNLEGEKKKGANVLETMKDHEVCQKERKDLRS